MSKTVLFFSDRLDGPSQEGLAIAKRLVQRGHRVHLLCSREFELGLRGVAIEPLFFAADAGIPPMRGGGPFWRSFLLHHGRAFATPALQQLALLILPYWEWQFSRLQFLNDTLYGQAERVHPDLILSEAAIAYSFIDRLQKPWIRLYASGETEIEDPALPPFFSGCEEQDSAGFRTFSQERERILKSLHRQFNEQRQRQGVELALFPHFSLPSPDHNFILFPRLLSLRRQEPLTAHRFSYLNAVEDSHANIEELPFPSGQGPIVLVDFGPLGHTDHAFQQRLAAVLAKMPLRAYWVAEEGAYQPAPLPANMLTISQTHSPAALARASLALHEGGHRRTMAALAAGIPSLAVPFGLESLDIATRLHDTGYGGRVLRQFFHPAQLEGMLSRFLADEGLKRRLAELAGIMRETDEIAMACDRIIALARDPAARR